MSLADLVKEVQREAGTVDGVSEAQLTLVLVRLEKGWAWTGSKRHAVPARELYHAAMEVIPEAGLATVYSAVRAAVAKLGGWFVLRGNLRHVRGCRVNHMTDVEAWKASRGLRKPWRRRTGTE